MKPGSVGLVPQWNAGHDALDRDAVESRIHSFRIGRPSTCPTTPGQAVRPWAHNGFEEEIPLCTSLAGRAARQEVPTMADRGRRLGLR